MFSLSQITHAQYLLCFQLFCQRIEKLKFNVQELQRDLTLRRCLIKTSAVTDLQEEIIDLKKDLDNLFLLTENKQPSLEKVCSL